MPVHKFRAEKEGINGIRFASSRPYIILHEFRSLPQELQNCWMVVVMVGMVLGADGASVTRTQRMDGDSNVSTIIGFYAGNLLHDTKLADVVVVPPALV